MDTLTPFEKAIVGVLKGDVESVPQHEHHPSLDVLLDHASGELPPRERAQVEAHALRCPSCRGRIDALAAGVETTMHSLCGQAPSWAFSTWLARRQARAQRPSWFPARVVWALGAAAAAVCLGVATWDIVKPEGRWVARGESAGGVPAAALVLFIVAGVLIVIGTLLLILRRWRR
jgi:anti-sigma factor ChrR (cupin superfamily)